MPPFVPETTAESSASKATPSLPGVEDGRDTERAALEARHARRIGAALRAQRASVLPEGVTPDTLGDWERRLRDSGPALRDALYALLSEGASLGAATGREQIDALLGVGPTKAQAVTVDWTLVNADALAWARQYAGTLVQQITDTTLTALRAALAEWVSNGLPLDALTAELAPVFGPERAERISTTEITRSYAEANRQAWHASGVIAEMQWRTAHDECVCPVCRPLDGTRAAVGQGFNPNPPAHVRCRCWVVPVVP